MAAIFSEALPVVFTAKNTHGQTVGGFCHDLSPLLGSLWVNGGHVAISVEAQHLDRWTHPQGRGCACVCVCFSVNAGLGEGGLWGNESAT